jgi:hypothetical protein
MAIRKNKKRIDPRYFLNETTYRDEIGEGPAPSSINSRAQMDVPEDELAQSWTELLQAVTAQVPELRDRMLRVIANDASQMAKEYQKQRG